MGGADSFQDQQQLPGVANNSFVPMMSGLAPLGASPANSEPSVVPATRTGGLTTGAPAARFTAAQPAGARFRVNRTRCLVESSDEEEAEAPRARVGIVSGDKQPLAAQETAEGDLETRGRLKGRRKFGSSDEEYLSGATSSEPSSGADGMSDASEESVSSDKAKRRRRLEKEKTRRGSTQTMRTRSSRDLAAEEDGLSNVSAAMARKFKRLAGEGQQHHQQRSAVESEDESGGPSGASSVSVAASEYSDEEESRGSRKKSKAGKSGSKRNYGGRQQRGGPRSPADHHLICKYVTQQATAAIKEALGGKDPEGERVIQNSIRRGRCGALKSFNPPKDVVRRAPDLKEYQIAGVHWLLTLHEQKLNGLLADEMGLGKTAESVTFLYHLYLSGQLTRPSVVACPATLLDNWVVELARWAPELKVLKYHGGQKARKVLMRKFQLGPKRAHEVDEEDEEEDVLLSDEEADQEEEQEEEEADEEEAVEGKEEEAEEEDKATAGYRSEMEDSICETETSAAAVAADAKMEDEKPAEPKPETGPDAAAIQMLRDSDKYHVLVTTHQTLSNKWDRALFLRHRKFAYMVVDEAHSLKNKESLLYQQMNRFVKSQHRLLLTGSPIQNQIAELRNLFEFLRPFDHQTSFDVDLAMEHFIGMWNATVRRREQKAAKEAQGAAPAEQPPAAAVSPPEKDLKEETAEGAASPAPVKTESKGVSQGGEEEEGSGSQPTPELAGGSPASLSAIETPPEIRDGMERVVSADEDAERQDQVRNEALESAAKATTQVAKLVAELPSALPAELSTADDLMSPVTTDSVDEIGGMEGVLSFDGITVAGDEAAADVGDMKEEVASVVPGVPGVVVAPPKALPQTLTPEVVFFQQLLSPLVLRRLKTEVIGNFPKKNNVIEYCEMKNSQHEVYNKEIKNAKPFFQQLFQRGAAQKKRDADLAGLTNKVLKSALGKNSASGSFVRSLISRLRRICNHPLLYQGYFSPAQRSSLAKFYATSVEGFMGFPMEKVVSHLERWSDFEVHREAANHLPALKEFRIPDEVFLESAKIRRMLEIVDDLVVGKKQKMLVFSQFTTYLDIIEEVFLLFRPTIAFLRLDGKTAVQGRSSMVRAFQDQDSEYRIFLLSTKAGGVGLNLTGASGVFLMDQDWNPHNDRQAEDRVHRLGQKNDVTVYRMCCQHSIEEAILACCKKKLELDEAFGGHAENLPIEVFEDLLASVNAAAKRAADRAAKAAETERLAAEEAQKKVSAESETAQDGAGEETKKRKRKRAPEGELDAPVEKSGLRKAALKVRGAGGAADDAKPSPKKRVKPLAPAAEKDGEKKPAAEKPRKSAAVSADAAKPKPKKKPAKELEVSKGQSTLIVKKKTKSGTESAAAKETAAAERSEDQSATAISDDDSSPAAKTAAKRPAAKKNSPSGSKSSSHAASPNTSATAEEAPPVKTASKPSRKGDAKEAAEGGGVKVKETSLAEKRAAIAARKVVSNVKSSKDSGQSHHSSHAGDKKAEASSAAQGSGSSPSRKKKEKENAKVDAGANDMVLLPGCESE